MILLTNKNYKKMFSLIYTLNPPPLRNPNYSTAYAHTVWYTSRVYSVERDENDVQ